MRDCYVGGRAVDRIKSLILAVLLFAPGFSFAAYTNATPPAGFGKAGAQFTQNAAQAFAAANGFGVNATLQAGGRIATLPATLPYGAGAARTAAGVLFKNPYLQGAIIVGSFLTGECFVVDVGVWKRTCGPEFGSPSTGFDYQTSSAYGVPPWGSKAVTCQSARYLFASGASATHTVTSHYVSGGGTGDFCVILHTRIDNGNQSFTQTGFSSRAAFCPVGQYQSGTTCLPSLPPITVSQSEFENKLATKAMPAGLPATLPGDYPVELPSIQPLTIPTGAPVPVPGTDPVTYEQPAITVSPAPTTDAPWRVDVKPISVPTTSPVGMTEPSTTATGSASNTTDFCQQHPTSHVCVEMGTLEPVEVPNENIQLAITPDTGWGPSNASCPAPKTVTVQGKTLSFSLQMICDAATMIRPLFIGFAWITAVMLFVGMARKEA